MSTGGHSGAAFGATLLVAALAPLSAAAGTLTIDVAGLDCPDRARTAQLIRAQVGDALESQPDVRVVLESQPPSQLVVQLIAIDQTTERVLALQRSECAQVPRTVAFLVRGWLNRRWTATPPPPPAAAAEPAAVAALAPAPAPANDPRALDVLLAAGGFAQPADARHGFAAAAAVDWSLSPRAGIGVELGYDAAVGKEYGRGSASVAVWRLAPLARLRLRPMGAAALDLMGGPALFLLQESSRGYLSSFDNRFVDFGLVAAARWRQPIAGRLAAIAAIDLQLRATVETVSVVNAGAALTLPRARLGALAGLAWEVF